MSGVFLLAHAITATIDERELIAVLAELGHEGPHEFLSCSPFSVRPEDSDAIDWQWAADEQRRCFDTEIAPRLRAQPTWPILYFGLVPIPLAVQLGFLLRGFPNHLHARLQAHRTWKWTWGPDPAPVPKLVPIHLPRDATFTGDVILRIASSYPIDPGETRIVEAPTKEIDLSLATPQLDALHGPDALAAFERAIRTTLDDIHEALPRSRAIHLFAATQVAPMLLLGLARNPTLHPAIQTYQYARGIGYQPALALGRPRARPTVLLLAASPSNAGPIAVGREFDHVKQMLESRRDRIALSPCLAVDAEALQRIVLTSEAEIVHFCGHGARAESDGEDGLVVLDAAGRSFVVRNEIWTRWFAHGRPRGVRCVLLSSCFGVRLAERTSEHVDVVIGFSGELSDEAALAFVRGFYEALVGGESLRQAFEFGRERIELAGHEGRELARIWLREGEDSSSKPLVARAFG